MNNHYHVILHHEAESQALGMMSTLRQSISTGTKQYIEERELKIDRTCLTPSILVLLAPWVQLRQQILKLVARITLRHSRFIVNARGQVLISRKA